MVVNERIDPDFTMGDVWKDIAERYGIKPVDGANVEMVLTTAEFASRFGVTRYKAYQICQNEVLDGNATVSTKKVECFGGLRTTTVQAYDFSMQKEKADVED